MKMHLRYIIAFLLLMLLIQEAHEITHMLTDGALHGCGGTRYFLFWDLCTTGPTTEVVITALAGPFMNYLFMWMGYSLLSNSATAVQKSWGFTFIMAALPLSRLQSLVLRGGDELLSFRKIMDPNPPFKGAPVIMGSLLILLLTVPPLWRAYKNAGNYKLLVFAGFFILPYIFTALLQKAIMNTGIKTGLLNAPTGWSALTWLVLLDLVLLLLFVITRKSIATLFGQR